MRKASSRRPVMRKKPICSAKASLSAGRSSLVVDDPPLRLGIREERLDLEAAQVTRQRAPAQIRGLLVVHVLPPEARHNTPLETAISKCLTSLGKTVSAAGLTERK